MTSTKTLYNELWRGGLPLTPFEVPDALKRRHTSAKGHTDKRSKGRSIDERPVEVSTRTVMGHWEADTVVGLRNGKEAVVFTLVERVTDNYIAMRIPGRTSESVQTAIRMFRTEYGDHFSDVFKTITADNGPEFENFAQTEQWGPKIYFAHPYSPWERPVNERHNGLLRGFVPKGTSIEKYSPAQIIAFSDELNGRPCRRLGYRTPEELFDAFLDYVYAVRSS